MPPAINANGVMVAADSLMTLYTYAGDGLEQSACVDACAEIWQPLLANGSDTSRGDFSVFSRSDGRWQWALMGKPLTFGLMRLAQAILGEKLPIPNGAPTVWQVSNKKKA